MDHYQNLAPVLETLTQEKRKAFDLNLYLAKNPEVSHKEVLAAAKYIELLKNEGIPVVESYMEHPTAFKATIHEDAASDIKIGILAEYDALPEIGHGCGHSASGALSFLAALSLFKNQASLKGNIYLIGCPGEEFGGVKTLYANSGAFDDFTFVVMLHMYDRNQPTSKFTALAGNVYEFTGAPAHAAACPWDGKNAFNGMTLFIHALDMLRQQLRDGARIHGAATKCGSAVNIIPDSASCTYLYRYETFDYLTEMGVMMENAAKGAAMATGTTVTITPPAPALADLKINHTATAAVAEIFGELGLPLDTEPLVALGSSDIGNLSYRCPALHPMLAITDQPLPIHTREFAEKMLSPEIEPVIENGAAIIIRLVMRAINDPAFCKAIRAEFDAR